MTSFCGGMTIQTAIFTQALARCNEWQIKAFKFMPTKQKLWSYHVNVVSI